jgi:membrane protein DedA with SNARE-associated domain/rhodanese-related sulfurtransferase
VHDIVVLVQHYGLLLVFLAVLVDESGLPIPSYPVLLVAGALAATSQAIAALIVVATAGGLLADLGWYWASARMGRRILNLMCRITLSPDSCVQRTETSFARFGSWTLPISKFVPGLGYVAVALSGITRMNILRFAAFDGVGVLLYVALPIALGSLFRGAVDAMLGRLVELGSYGLLLVVAAFALYVGARWLERKAFARRLRMARISVTELAAMIESGNAPVIFDVREKGVRQESGMIPGAVAAHSSNLEALTQSYPRDLEIVIYCACPNEASAAIAALHLKRAGFSNIRPLLGGIDAWSNAGQPLEKSADAHLSAAADKRETIYRAA